MSRPRYTAPNSRDVRGCTCVQWRKGWPADWFAGCEIHGCPQCWHWAHEGGDGYGCGAPDSRTGWCECDYTATLPTTKPLLHKGRKP